MVPAGALRERSKVMRWIVRMALPLAVFWLVLSGHVEPLFLALGGASVVLVCWVSLRADLAEQHAVTFPLALRLPRYLLWLGKEMLVSSVAVVWKVWSPRPALRPVVTATPSRDMPDLSQVVYANSITLTPGTLSLDVADDRIEVHSLDEANADTLHAGAMLRRVRQLEIHR
jgi:multicomponent Na+:H+ antiporter subunit E